MLARICSSCIKLAVKSSRSVAQKDGETIGDHWEEVPYRWTKAIIYMISFQLVHAI